MTRRALPWLVLAGVLVAAGPIVAVADDIYTLTNTLVTGAAPGQMAGGEFAATGGPDSLGVERPQGGGYTLVGQAGGLAPATSSLPPAGVARILLPSVPRQISLGEVVP